MIRSETTFLSGCLLCLLLPAVFTHAYAESESPDAPSRPISSEQPVAIQIGKITPEAEAVEDALESAADHLLNAQFSLKIAENLLGFEKVIQANQERLETVFARPLLHERLQQQKIAWQSTSEQIQQLIRLLEDRISDYESLFSEIGHQTAIWEKTQTNVRQESAPPAIINRANSILKTLKSHEQKFRKERNKILDQQNKAAELLDSVTQNLNEIKSAQREIETGIFSAQNRPIWHLEPGSVEVPEKLENTASLISQLQSETRVYVQSNFDRIITHGLLVVALGWFLQRRRKVLERINHSADHASDSGSVAYSILGYPWAAAILIGILWATFSFPDQVLGFKILTTIVGVAAWLRVISSLLSTVFLGPVIAVALIATVDLLHTTFGEFGASHRATLTLLIVSAIATVFWIRRIQRNFPLFRTTVASFWPGIFAVWIRLCQISLILGLFSVLLGYTLLAYRLASLAIWGSILATAFLFSVLLVESVVRSMVEEHLFDRIRMIRANHGSFIRVVRVALRLTGFCSWFYLVLKKIKLLGPFQEWTSDVLSHELGREPVTFSIGDLLAFLLTLWISWLLARFLTFALDQEVFTRLRVGAGIPFAITTFTRYTILVVGFLAALAVLGFPLDKVTLLLSALGVGIGFGLQNITNNFISGIILLFERPIRVGDKIQLDDLVGTVASIGIRASTIRGFDGSDVIVPNGDFISARVTNWTLADQQRRIVLPVHIAYGAEPEKVLELLQQIAGDNPEILRNPTPEPLFRGFGTNAMEFELRAWTESERGWMAVMSDLALATSRALREAGIQIPLPQRTVTISNLPELGKALARVIHENPLKRPDPAQS